MTDRGGCGTIPANSPYIMTRNSLKVKRKSRNNPQGLQKSKEKKQKGKKKIAFARFCGAEARLYTLQTAENMV